MNLPTLTHLFSQGGRFFMVCDQRNVPVGFVRLVGIGASYELVIVIGERGNWGRRLGTQALQQGLKKAFLELRAETLIARIHPDNQWSIRAFSNCGFQLERETASLLTFRLARDRYLALSRSTCTAASDPCITLVDRDRLQKLIPDRDGRLKIQITKVLHQPEAAGDFQL